jgi:hypothetical protein
MLSATDAIIGSTISIVARHLEDHRHCGHCGTGCASNLSCHSHKYCNQRQAKQTDLCTNANSPFDSKAILIQCAADPARD